MPRRSAIVLVVVIALILVAFEVRLLLSRWPEAFPGLFEAYPAGERLVLKPAGFADLPGWGEDALEEAVPVFLRSCPHRRHRQRGRLAGRLRRGGQGAGR